jgi:hypothetical protein
MVGVSSASFKQFNGVKATGGSIDGPGPVVVNGMVFINSGYSRFGRIPGNVVLAFSPAGDKGTQANVRFPGDKHDTGASLAGRAS